MKKIELYLTIIILSFSFFGCDPPRYYNYFITNRCNEEIEIKIVVCLFNCGTIHNNTTEKPSIKISPNATQLIYVADLPQPIKDDKVELFFEEIIIKKGNVTSKNNYVDKSLWDFKKSSKNHADSYLTVYPEDFEDE